MNVHQNSDNTTDTAAVSPAPSAAPPRVMQRVDLLAAKLSRLLSYAVMVGLPALALALQFGPQSVPKFRSGAPAQTAAMPEVRSRTVSTVRISVTPKRVEEKKALAALPVTAPQPAPAPIAAPAVVAAPTQTLPAPKPAEAAVEAPAVASWSVTDVASALRQCVTLLADHNVQFEPQDPVRQGSCGTPAPIKTKALGRPEVTLQPPSVMNCNVAAGVARWVDRVLQPAAKEIFSSPVVRLVGTGSYTCRNRNGASDGPISEHAFANAFDVAGFVLADGRTINVLGGWGRIARDDASANGAKVADAAKPVFAPGSRSALKGPPVLVATGTDSDVKPELSAEAKFLRRIHAEACGLFGTVLGPEANDAHRNHLHFDLKERKGKSYCQ